MSGEERLRQYGETVEAALEGFLPSEECLQKNVLSAMRYSLMAGGKRIRPALTLEFCRVCGGDTAAALPFACAVEMVHTYSLIHDDLPCMDNDDMRRGRPSCHVQYGEATALLAGDALLSLAFETALCNNIHSAPSPDAVVAASRELASASGVMGMVGGQIIDLEYENKKADLHILEEMHRGKTGAMIVAACKMGCLAAGATKAQLDAAVEYARRVGLAFQIEDDILDCTSTTEKLGKKVGSDSQNEKSTYVTLLGIEKSRRLVEELTAQAVQALSLFGGEGEFLRQLAVLLSKRES